LDALHACDARGPILKIDFFVNGLGFELVEDSPSETNDGRAKRWVVVRPPTAVTGLLLAQADGDEQRSVVGGQTGGRVGFFLHVEDFEAAYARMTSAGVQFVRAPRSEPFGQVLSPDYEAAGKGLGNAWLDGDLLTVMAEQLPGDPAQAAVGGAWLW
jgi:catechol 2,3-dioxygenase-like lactoylglutathione lyase family enzyme